MVVQQRCHRDLDAAGPATDTGSPRSRKPTVDQQDRHSYPFVPGRAHLLARIGNTGPNTRYRLSVPTPCRRTDLRVASSVRAGLHHPQSGPAARFPARIRTSPRAPVGFSRWSPRSQRDRPHHISKRPRCVHTPIRYATTPHCDDHRFAARHRCRCQDAPRQLERRLPLPSHAIASITRHGDQQRNTLLTNVVSATTTSRTHTALTSSRSELRIDGRYGHRGGRHTLHHHIGRGTSPWPGHLEFVHPPVIAPRSG